MELGLFIMAISNISQINCIDEIAKKYQIDSEKITMLRSYVEDYKRNKKLSHQKFPVEGGRWYLQVNREIIE